MMMVRKHTISKAFVTGATGLLGNNLVKALLERGFEVRALVRSVDKGKRQFFEHQNLQLITGDMQDVGSFADALDECDTLFHTAAYFRDSYSGGRHGQKMKTINVDGTAALLEAAYQKGIRNFVHTSSIAVLNGPAHTVIDETMLRELDDGDEYYQSKILSERVVLEFLEKHPDCHGSFVLPGWMHGPGDLGPTSAGRFTLDYLNKNLPGLANTSFAFVDARDVAEIHIMAAIQGQRGHRYLAAGYHIAAADLASKYQEVTGISAPRWVVPLWLLYIIGFMNEIYARVTGRPVLLGLAAVHLIRSEAYKTQFNHDKTKSEFNVSFRKIEETIQDEIASLRKHQMLV